MNVVFLWKLSAIIGFVNTSPIALLYKKIIQNQIKNVLRGLHYQTAHTQGKLVRVVIGSVFDVAVDLRKSSPTFGKWFGTVLSAENKRQLWIPEGFAHGFYTLENNTEFVYKCTDYYDPSSEHSLLWNDPTIGIEWNLIGEPNLSAKDMASKILAEAVVFE